MPTISNSVREELKEMTKEFDKSEDDLKALQSGVGQIVGEVLRQLTEDKCIPYPVYFFTLPSVFFNDFYIVIVKASNGPRYVVGCRRQVSYKETSCLVVKLPLANEVSWDSCTKLPTC